MSTRKDGLSIAVVNRTIRHVLAAYGVNVVGGNARVLHLRQIDGGSEVATATDRYGFRLDQTLAVHGFTIRERAGVPLVDLLQCDCADRSIDLAELLAQRDAREARTAWRKVAAADEDPPGRSAAEDAAEKGNETYRWAMHETAPRLRHWLASTPAAPRPTGNQ